MEKFKTPLLWLCVAGVGASSAFIVDDRAPLLGFTILGGALVAVGSWVAGEVVHRHKEHDQKSEKDSGE